MSHDPTASQGDDLQGDDLRVKAKHDRTGTTIILEGEFDMTGTDRFWAFFWHRYAAARPARAPRRPASATRPAPIRGKSLGTGLRPNRRLSVRRGEQAWALTSHGLTLG